MQGVISNAQLHQAYCLRGLVKCHIAKLSYGFSISKNTKRKELYLDMPVRCGECSAFYHFVTCSSLKEKQYRSDSVASRQKWACSTCKTAKSKDAQKHVDVRHETGEIRLLLCSISQKFDVLMPLKETVSNIERPVQMISEQYEELLRRLENHEKENKDIQKRMGAIEAQCKKKRKILMGRKCCRWN